MKKKLDFEDELPYIIKEEKFNRIELQNGGKVAWFVGDNYSHYYYDYAVFDGFDQNNQEQVKRYVDYMKEQQQKVSNIVREVGKHIDHGYIVCKYKDGVCIEHGIAVGIKINGKEDALCLKKI